MFDMHSFHHPECSIPCRYKWRRRRWNAQVVDLSFEGAIISQSSPAPRPGSQLIVELGLGGGRLPLSAKVVYRQTSSQGLFGVQFGGSCEDNLKRLEPFLKPEMASRASQAEV